jgi:hypothetical protein
VNYENIVDYLGEIKDEQFSIKGFFSEQLQFIQEQNEATLRLFNTKMDSLLQIYELMTVEGRKLVEERKLKERLERQNTINLLTSSLDHFISRSLDLKDAFSNNRDALLKDRYAKELVIEWIKKYSEAYEELNRNRKKINNQVKLYWEEEIRSFEVRSLLDDALNRIHKEINLVANNLIKDVNDYWTPGKKSKRRKQIVSEIRDFTTKLHYSLDNLKEKKERIYQSLIERRD